MEILSARAPWYVAGPVIGLLIVGLLWIANQPLGALGGYIEIDEWALGTRTGAGWRTWFIVGAAVGGFVSAYAGPGWRPTFGYGSFDSMFGAALPLKSAVLFSAGALMGVGGRMAGGCTSGHGLCGTSFGSPASVVSTVTFMTVAIAVMFTLTWVFGAS